MKHIAAFLIFAAPAFAEAPEIVETKAMQSGADWRFDVTLAHPDTGWDHYADGWRVEDADGAVLGTRILHHPHVSEQPFTRSVSGVSVPDGMTSVFIRAKCSVDGWSETTVELKLK